jgi:hypothetical protein
LPITLSVSKGALNRLANSWLMAYG